MRKQFVVAAYKEDVSWAKSLPTRLYIKGDWRNDWGANANDTINVCGVQHPLLNVGREAHTYLHHIVTHYDDLADTTVFLQGAPLEHFNKADFQLLVDCEPKAMAGLNMVDINEWDDSGQLSESWKYGVWAKKMRAGEVRRSSLSFVAWHNKFVGTLGSSTRYYMGAMFAVSRSAIHRRQRGYYEWLLRQVNNHIDPEEAYYLERCWPAVFMAGDEAVGLNFSSLSVGNHKGFGRIKL